MVSIQEPKKVSNIFLAQIFLKLLAIIFDTFLIDHTVVMAKLPTMPTLADFGQLCLDLWPKVTGSMDK